MMASPCQACQKATVHHWLGTYAALDMCKLCEGRSAGNRQLRTHVLPTVTCSLSGLVAQVTTSTHQHWPHSAHRHGAHLHLQAETAGRSSNSSSKDMGETGVETLGWLYCMPAGQLWGTKYVWIERKPMCVCMHRWCAV
jgi:hypothetical protein